MRKSMARLLVGLGLWIVVCELFLLLLRWLTCKRTPQQEAQAEPVLPTPEPPPQEDALPSWKRCSACTTYVRSVAQQCPCGGQCTPVSQSQMTRVFTVQWAAAEAIPEDERETFAAFVLHYEELTNRFVPVDITLRLYHLSQPVDEVAR